MDDRLSIDRRALLAGGGAMAASLALDTPWKIPTLD